MFYSDKKYDFKLVEKDCYDFWKNHGYFAPRSYQKQTKYFSIILPPPNVTGHLHIGHAYDGTIQDVLIRYHRLNGFNTIWLPGVDHAGIATQTKFDKVLKEQNRQIKNKKEYLTELQKWAFAQREFIHQQWAQLGFCLSYDDESYTLDNNAQKIVLDAFIKLYQKKLIYQDYKLVNWDVKLQTAISDIEVIYQEHQAQLYYFKYRLVDSPDDYLLVATSRPETMFGDICLFVHPKDARYKKYLHQKVINPINQEIIPIYTDEYIDPKFGTGVMKCTPAHDFHDYELAIKHHLNEYHSVFNFDGTLTKECIINNHSYAGIDRLVAREQIVKQMQQAGSLLKIENYTNQIGISERTKEIVEPMLSKQWFVKMKPIADGVLKELNQNKKALNVYPTRFKKTLIRWLSEIKDWCISRQLMWGHQLPVYYGKNNEVYVGINPPKNYRRDSSVLDTWFSSGLWPLITTKYNKNHDCSCFYPISYLVTAYDILFFWIARMLFQCHYLDKTIPFKNLLIHGLIRDPQNRKMSKSLNNGIEPNDLINQYGADALRLYLMANTTLGDDIRFSHQKIKYMSEFLNKLWNVHNYLQQYNFVKNSVSISHPANQWILQKFNNFVKKIQQQFKQNNFSVLTGTIINFIWNDFCNIYLEIIRPLLNDSVYQNETISLAYDLFRKLLIIIHPFAPFISENLYQTLPNHETSIMLESWPKPYFQKINKHNVEVIDLLIKVVFHVKEYRIRNHIQHSQQINLNLCHKKLLNHIASAKSFLNRYHITLKDIGVAPIKRDWQSINDDNLLIEFETIAIDDAKQKAMLEQKKIKYLNEIKRSESILNNPAFLKKAPKQKIAEEKKKYQIYLDALAQIKKQLKEE